MKRKKYDWSLLLLSIPCLMSSIIRIILNKWSGSLNYYLELFMLALPTIAVVVVAIILFKPQKEIRLKIFKKLFLLRERLRKPKNL